MAKRTNKSKSSPPPAPVSSPSSVSAAKSATASSPVLVENETVHAQPAVVAPRASVVEMAAPRAMVSHEPVMSASHEQIARRAFELFLARGGRNGHQLEDWLNAERELVRVA